MRLEDTNVFRIQRPLDRPTMGKPDIVIVCKCGRMDSIRAKANSPSQAVANMFRNRGWRVDADGKSATCRDCQMKKRANGAMPSASAMSGIVAAVRLLDEHFDTDAGSYDQGWSDEAVAEKVGLSVDAVATMREADYGPLAVSPEVAKIEADILLVQKRFQDELTEVRDLLSTMSKDFGTNIAAIRMRLDEATKGLKKTNGGAA